MVDVILIIYMYVLHIYFVCMNTNIYTNYYTQIFSNYERGAWYNRECLNLESCFAIPPTHVPGISTLSFLI